MKSLPKFYMGKHKPGYGQVVTVCLLLFFLTAAASLLFGSASLSFGDLLNAANNDAVRRFFLHVRLPRTLVAAMAGGSFVMLCDILARVLFASFEIPVGILMSYLGGPFFLWLLIRNRGGRSHD